MLLLGIAIYRFGHSAPNLYIKKTSVPLTKTPTTVDTKIAATVHQAGNTLESSSKVFLHTDPPIVLSYLENYTTLKFLCLNSEECYSDLDLSPYIAQYVEASKWNNSIAEGRSIFLRVHYVNQASIYIVLFSVAFNEPIILNFNPETNLIRSITLPDLTTFWWEKSYTIFDGKIAVLSRTGERNLASNTVKNVLLVIQSDLSVKKIDLNDTCAPAPRILIAGADGNLILLSVETLFQESKHFAQTCIVNTISGKQTERLIEIPKTVWVYGISADLGKLYYLFTDAKIKRTGRILGSYDTISTEENVIYNDQCINMQGGYEQYNGMIFSENFGLTEGNALATMIRLDDFYPIICDGMNSQLNMIRELKVVPFGEYFLLGSRTEIILITPDGETKGQSALPLELLGSNYQIMEYRQ